jgi:hypothetical protein
MRTLLIALLAVCLLTLACSDDGVDSTERAVAELINAYLEDDEPVSYIKPGTLLNLEDHKSSCTIGEGATTGIEPMPATCEWKTWEENGQTYIDLVEKWKCSEFNERAGREEFCKEDTAEHMWRWSIDETNAVMYLGDAGATHAESFYLPAE